MRKMIIYIVIGLLSILYGFLIGKYEVFPYRHLAQIKAYFTEEGKIEEVKNHSFPVPNIDSLISITPEIVDSIKTDLNKIIFGLPTLPKTSPDTIYEVKDPDYRNFKNLLKIEAFEITQRHNIKSKGYIFHPKVSNQQLLIYHQGHQGDFIYGIKSLAAFLEKGFTVYAFSMPLLGKNNQPIIELNKLGSFHLNTHERFKYLENPIQYFITPVVTMINYASEKSFQDITMVGLSGGGWTTTIAAAVDSRIKYSFPVAGTYPMYLRLQKPKKNYGDFEQTYPDLYARINYLDLYILGAIGKDRSQLQILNKYDPCCFDGEDYKTYISEVKSSVEKFHSGKFDVFLDTSHREHKISEAATQVIFNHLAE